MKIGIMGGTFDPIHLGHITIAKEAYKQYSLDQVWFMPNGNPPHKQEKKHITDAKDRQNMVSLAIEEYPQFVLSTYEIERGGLSYSYQTMEEFSKLYPENEFYFIIGADSLFSIEKWVYPERLVKTCVLLAAYRDDKDTPEEMNDEIQRLCEKYDADIRLIKSPLVHISSSELREELKRSDTENTYLPHKVWEYIKREHLYE